MRTVLILANFMAIGQTIPLKLLTEYLASTLSQRNEILNSAAEYYYGGAWERRIHILKFKLLI